MKINSSLKSSVVSRRFVFIYCLFFMAFLTGCAKIDTKNIGSRGKNIICFGDSVTFGYGVNKQEAYPALLAKMVDRPVLNMGIDGDTSVEAVKRLDNDALERNPFMVIIEFGGNDFLRKIPVELTVKNISEMVDRIHAAGAMAAIVDISAGPVLSEYRRGFARVAKEKKAIFIRNVFLGIILNPRTRSDFIHPNAQGYKLIARGIHRAVAPYLKENALLNQPQK